MQFQKRLIPFFVKSIFILALKPTGDYGLPSTHAIRPIVSPAGDGAHNLHILAEHVIQRVQTDRHATDYWVYMFGIW